MSIQNIFLAGLPSLRHLSSTVDPQWFGSNLSKKLVEDLFLTLKARNGAGLSAPQIGVPLRIFVYGFEYNSRYPDQDPIPLNIMINPQIISASAECVYLYEGCLSFPEIRGLVPRHECLTVSYQNLQGEKQEVSVSGFEARIIQHEIDHLDGVLFPERMDNLRTLGVTSALRETGIIR